MDRYAKCARSDTDGICNGLAFDRIILSLEGSSGTALAATYDLTAPLWSPAQQG